MLLLPDRGAQCESECVCSLAARPGLKRSDGRMTPRLEPAKGRQLAGAMAHDEPHHEPARAASRNSTNLKRCVTLYHRGPLSILPRGFPAAHGRQHGARTWVDARARDRGLSRVPPAVSVNPASLAAHCRLKVELGRRPADAVAAGAAGTLVRHPL